MPGLGQAPISQSPVSQSGCQDLRYEGLAIVMKTWGIGLYIKRGQRWYNKADFEFSSHCHPTAYSGWVSILLHCHHCHLLPLYSAAEFCCHCIPLLVFHPHMANHWSMSSTQYSLNWDYPLTISLCMLTGHFRLQSEYQTMSIEQATSEQ